MKINTVYSITGILIRLTDERWQHFITQHGELTTWQADVLRAGA